MHKKLTKKIQNSFAVLYLSEDFHMDSLGRIILNSNNLLERINGAVTNDLNAGGLFDGSCDGTCGCNSMCSCNYTCWCDLSCNPSCASNNVGCANSMC